MYQNLNINLVRFVLYNSIYIINKEMYQIIWYEMSYILYILYYVMKNVPKSLQFYNLTVHIAFGNIHNSAFAKAKPLFFLSA